MMLTSSFSFDLPPELIAQEPAAERGASRLMVMHRGEQAEPVHTQVQELARHVAPGTLMVFNDSRVRKARLFARPLDAEAFRSGATPHPDAALREREFLLAARRNKSEWLVLTPGGKRLKAGRRFLFPEGRGARIGAEEVESPYRLLLFDAPINEAYLERNGHVPLPPYIHRADSPADAARYQTVYARSIGSVAAPTAGLHFTEPLLATLRAAGVEIRFITLHVGIGTFLPVRTETIEEHAMHSESYRIDTETADAITAAKREGRPVHLRAIPTSSSIQDSSFG